MFVFLLGVSEWTVDDVCQWLDGIGFSQCIETACSLQCDGKQLLSMKTEDMHVINREKIIKGGERERREREREKQMRRDRMT